MWGGAVALSGHFLCYYSLLQCCVRGLQKKKSIGHLLYIYTYLFIHLFFSLSLFHFSPSQTTFFAILPTNQPTKSWQSFVIFFFFFFFSLFYFNHIFKFETVDIQILAGKQNKWSDLENGNDLSIYFSFPHACKLPFETKTKRKKKKKKKRGGGVFYKVRVN